jgi:hypothetical protein
MATRTALVQVAGQIEQLQPGDALAGAVALTAAGGGISTGTASFANSNGVSFGINGQTVTASINALAGGGIALAAGTQTATSGTAIFADSNGVSFGMSGSSQVTVSVAAVKTISAGTTNNSNGVSFGVNGSTLTATVAAQVPFGISAGTQSVSTGTLNFADSNGVSFGMSGSSQVTVSVAAVKTISAGTTNLVGPGVSFANSNGLAFGVNGSTITARTRSRRARRVRRRHADRHHRHDGPGQLERHHVRDVWELAGHRDRRLHPVD